MTPRFYQIEPELISVDDLAMVYVGNDFPVSDPYFHWDRREIAVCTNSPAGRGLLSDTTRSRFLCSAEFRAVLQGCAIERIRFLPIQLQSLDGETHYPDWSILVVEDECPLVEADLRAIKYDIFREPWSDDVYVSEELKAAIVTSGLKRIKFSLWNKS